MSTSGARARRSHLLPLARAPTHARTAHSAQKGNFLGPAAKEGIAILFPDTSPRGAGIEGEADSWDFGVGEYLSLHEITCRSDARTRLANAGAGFYLNATNPKWAKHYNMLTHVTIELPQVLEAAGLPVVRLSLPPPCPIPFAR